MLVVVSLEVSYRDLICHACIRMGEVVEKGDSINLALLCELTSINSFNMQHYWKLKTALETTELHKPNHSGNKYANIYTRVQSRLQVVSLRVGMCCRLFLFVLWALHLCSLRTKRLSWWIADLIHFAEQSPRLLRELVKFSVEFIYVL